MLFSSSETNSNRTTGRFVATDKLFTDAVRLHRTGNLGTAIEIYQRIVNDCPTHAGAWHMLGVARQQQGRFEESAAYLRQALNLDSAKAIYHNNYCVVLQALGKWEEARQAIEQALALNPRYADAHSNHGLVLSKLGRPAEAIASFRRALALAPDHADALFNLANLFQELGRRQEAIPLYREVVRLQPNRLDAQINLGNVLLADRQADKAAAYYRKVLAVAPDHAAAQLNLGMAYAVLDQHDDAAQAFAAAAALRPEKSVWKLRSLGLCPAIFQSEEEVDAYRTGLEARLDEALRRPISVAESELAYDGFAPSFNLAHHGRGNRRLLEKFAALFTPHIRKRRPRPRGGKPRIGFVVTAPHVGSFLRTKAGIVERLDNQAFEIVVFCAEQGLETCRGGIHRQGVHYVPFPQRFSEAADRIAAARCQVLYFHKVSADPLSYLLPFARLAPVQCTSWATHNTSGVPDVDYYLSSALVEAGDADGHYSESLVRLKTFPTYERAPSPLPPAQRSDFGLPEDGGLYIAPQRLPKFHPAQDGLFREVLEADPRGHLVLVADRRDHVLQSLLARFEKTLGPAARRVIVLPSQSLTDFRRLLGVCDALLDIGHYSVSLMGYDAFAADLPVVTLPGKYKVERYALGFFRQLEQPEAAATTPEQYVELAKRLGTERDFRAAFRDWIAVRKQLLFDNVQVVQEFQSFFEQAIQTAKKTID